MHMTTKFQNQMPPSSMIREENQSSAPASSHDTFVLNMAQGNLPPQSNDHKQPSVSGKRSPMQFPFKAGLPSHPPQKKRRFATSPIPSGIGQSIPLMKASWWKIGGSPKTWVQKLQHTALEGQQSVAARVSTESLNQTLQVESNDMRKMPSVTNNNHFATLSNNQQAEVSNFLRQIVGKQPLQIASVYQKLHKGLSSVNQGFPNHKSPVLALLQEQQQQQQQQQQQLAQSQAAMVLNGRQPNEIVDEDDCSNDGTTASGESGGLNFRAYQAENWTEKFEELIAFRDQFGHCLVPNSFPENPALAQWVKRQRYQYKLKFENKRSTMSDERINALEEIGFVWDSHRAVWDERYHELLAYKQANGHCNVPSRYAANRQLAVWVKRQRRQNKFYNENKPSSMTQERIHRLEAIGFEWDLRRRDEDLQNC